MRQKYYKQKQIANADYVKNLIRQWNSYELAQIGKRTIHDRVCATFHFNIHKEMGVN